MLKQHFEHAVEHVVLGEMHVAKQQQRIALLERKGLDLVGSRELLLLFEQLLAVHIANLDRIRHELEVTPP